MIKRDFTAKKPLEKCVTDMTELKASDGKLYVSAIFDCYEFKKKVVDAYLNGEGGYISG